MENPRLSTLVEKITNAVLDVHKEKIRIYILEIFTHWRAITDEQKVLALRKEKKSIVKSIAYLEEIDEVEVESLL
jgi:hypothetical protein